MNCPNCDKAMLDINVSPNKFEEYDGVLKVIYFCPDCYKYYGEKAYRKSESKCPSMTTNAPNAAK